MVKKKKKRNKVYTGIDAAITKPIITKITAKNRSKLGQWWFDRKATILPIVKVSAIVLFVIFLIVEIVRIINGSY